MEFTYDSRYRKITATHCTLDESRNIMKSCSGASVKSMGVVRFDDSLFNRIALGIDPPQEIYTGYTINKPFNPKARDYQKEDITRMVQFRYVLNCNKMGYGKTFEAIEYCRMLGLKDILVVCPKSVIEQWQDQFKLWWPDGDYKLSVINYDKIRMDKILSSYRATLWDIVICDECHRLKNPKAATTLAVKQLRSKYRMGLTGTPILNRPNDLWSQLDWLCRDYAGPSYWEFAKFYCDWDISQFGYQFRGLTPSNTRKESLSKGLALISVGGTRQAVGSGKQIIEVGLTLPPANRKLYNNIKELAIEELRNKDINITNAMDQMLKLQQATSNPTLLDNKLTNPKFEWIHDAIKDSPDESFVIFSRFAKTVKALHEYLGDESICYTGDMTTRQRDIIKSAFIERKKRILIATIGAIGIGVDGLQTICHNAIFIDRDWSPALNEQAEARLDRMGQLEQVNVYKLYAKNTIDKYVDSVLRGKLEDIEELREWIQYWC